ncbi:DUF6557 family protein [Gelidibacter gilvus]|uniref:Uncharacterized protein n=1 Tax=Gelidibacter gilvus TaxID=59602 RepID=A0A4Q0XHR9_9FLAO|nr:DUF6557 family protein [Gelidibacter gilvus]RXJ51114.1 hypothetical protein ESZ48_04350 [Gelidibacter gilvus]
MKLKQLLQTNDWPAILPIFLKTYPEAEENINGYRIVFEKLVMLSPKETDMSIVITQEKDGDEDYIDVSGLHNNPKNKEETYSQGIELVSWREWLGMDISKESLANFSESEIIVHCIYEMTYIGFTEEVIQEKNDRIEKSRKARESMTDEESDAITASVEEILRTWREEDSD